MSSRQYGTISLVALDSLLYGAARAFDYLGDDGQEMLDKIGGGIVEYLTNKGFLQKSNDLQQMASELANFFRENGYVGQVSLDPKGEVVTLTIKNWTYLPLMKNLRSKGSYLLVCPLCIANNSVLRSNGLGWKRVSEEVDNEGTGMNEQVQVVPIAQATVNPPTLADLTTIPETNPDTQVGIFAFEAVEYGLMRGFDYLGAQAELFLDAIGRGILEFLKEEAGFHHSDKLGESTGTLASFFTKNGLADRIDVQLSHSDVRVEFENYRYAPVLKQALSEGLRSVSCPFLLALKALLRGDGRTVEESKWDFRNERNASLVMRLRGVTDEFDEERTNALMD
jgi:hypothetical protein